MEGCGVSNAAANKVGRNRVHISVSRNKCGPWELSLNLATEDMRLLREMLCSGCGSFWWDGEETDLGKRIIEGIEEELGGKMVPVEDIKVLARDCELPMQQYNLESPWQRFGRRVYNKWVK